MAGVVSDDLTAADAAKLSLIRVVRTQRNNSALENAAVNAM
jgi:hypothetical protein